MSTVKNTILVLMQIDDRRREEREKLLSLIEERRDKQLIDYHIHLKEKKNVLRRVMRNNFPYTGLSQLYVGLSEGLGSELSGLWI